MRKLFVLSTLAACVVATPALAEDGDWTGPYVGVSVGYSAAKSRTDVALGGNWSTESTTLQSRVVGDWSANQSADLGVYGGQIGYNYQTSGNLVLGVEIDAAALSGHNDRSFVSTGSPTYTFGNHIDPKALFTARAKLGFAAGDTLFYAHGGWAGVKATMSADVVSSGGYTKEGVIDKTTSGWVAGAGVEHRFGSNMSARLEYSYVDQGKEVYSSAYRTGSTFVTPAYGETFTQDLRLHVIRLGVNFHF